MSRNSAIRKGNRLGAMIAAGALVLGALPTAGFALDALGGGISSQTGAFAALTPASVDPSLAKLMSEYTGGSARLIRFTPAGALDGADRAVTVAVRVDEDLVRTITVRSAIEAAKEQVAAESGVRIAPTRYNLGLSRGYQNFAKVGGSVSPQLSAAEIPDLADFRPSAGARADGSRFAARIAPVGDERSVSLAGEQTVDVAGSYRLTRNLDVTAGVRYSQDQDRLAPLPDSSKQDSQAVYIGTQFRF